MFVLVENLMSKNVTMKNTVTLFDVSEFKKAVDLIKQKLFNMRGVDILFESPNSFVYRIKEDGGLSVTGIIENKPVVIVDEQGQTR